MSRPPSHSSSGCIPSSCDLKGHLLVRRYAYYCAAACGLSASALYLVLHRIQGSAALLEGGRAML